MRDGVRVGGWVWVWVMRVGVRVGVGVGCGGVCVWGGVSVGVRGWNRVGEDEGWG